MASEYRALEGRVRDLHRLLAVHLRNIRWCDHGLEITCDRALDCYDREAIGHVATPGGITAEEVQDVMVATVEHRCGPVNYVPEPIEWLTDNPVPSEAEGGS